MTSNNRLDWTELQRIDEFGKREAIKLEGKLQAIVSKLVAIGAELEDQHTCQFTVHLGRRVGDVKVDLLKKGY